MLTWHSSHDQKVRNILDLLNMTGECMKNHKIRVLALTFIEKARITYISELQILDSSETLEVYRSQHYIFLIFRIDNITNQSIGV